MDILNHFGQTMDIIRYYKYKFLFIYSNKVNNICCFTDVRMGMTIIHHRIYYAAICIVLVFLLICFIMTHSLYTSPETSICKYCLAETNHH